MSSNLDAFVRRMDKLADTLSRTPRDMVTASARAYTNTIRNEISAVTAGSRLRGVGRKGARVGVKYDVQGQSAPTAIVQATGPLHLIERDTRPHMIPRTQSSRRLRTASGRLSRKRETTGRALSGRTLLLINGDWVTGPVRHPGTKGKHPFAKGVRRAEVNAFTTSLLSLHTVMSQIFGGH